jgi:hypothetical protein
MMWSRCRAKSWPFSIADIEVVLEPNNSPGIEKIAADATSKVEALLAGFTAAMEIYEAAGDDGDKQIEVLDTAYDTGEEVIAELEEQLEALSDQVIGGGFEYREAAKAEVKLALLYAVAAAARLSCWPSSFLS